MKIWCEIVVNLVLKFGEKSLFFGAKSYFIRDPTHTEAKGERCNVFGFKFFKSKTRDPTHTEVAGESCNIFWRKVLGERCNVFGLKFSKSKTCYLNHTEETGEICNIFRLRFSVSKT